MVGINRYTRIKEDSALGIVLSVFFGLGLLLLTWIQRSPDARQSGLTTFLFGQAATMLERDVIVIAGLGALALVAVFVFWKEFKLLSCDPDFGAALGFPMRTIDVLLTTFWFGGILSDLLGGVIGGIGTILDTAAVVGSRGTGRVSPFFVR